MAQSLNSKCLLQMKGNRKKELERIYEEFYSESIVQKKHALGRIGVWKSRVLNKIPVAVESTASFVAANLEYQRVGETPNESLALRNLYSMALIRFINHITERQQNTVLARPVHKLAAELGLPELIVELRHAATHSELPPLNILKVAADWCLKWLKEEFWEVQLSASTTAGNKNGDTQMLDIYRVRDVLVSYQQHRFQHITKRKYKPNRRLRGEINLVVETMGSEVCACMVDEGYLIMTTEQLASLNIKKRRILKGDLLLPKKILRFWKYMLQRLADNGLLMRLLLALQSAATEDLSLKNKLLYSWMYSILYHNESKRGSVFGTQVTVPYRQLLDVCIQAQSPYSIQLIEWLLGHIGSDELSLNSKKALKQLVTMYLSSPLFDDYTTDLERLHTVKEIQDRKQEHSKWSRCVEPFDWSSYSFGLLPNQNLEYNSLELFSEEADLINGISKRTEDAEKSKDLVLMDADTEPEEKPLSDYSGDYIVDNVTKDLFCKMEC